MNPTPEARLRAADPAAGRPGADPRDAAARALFDRIVAEPVPGRGRPRHRLLAAGVTAAAAAAVAVAGVVTTPWSPAQPAASAYAVTRNGDGTVGVTVHWDELRDPAALNAELAAQGARTVVMRTSADGQCRTGFALDPAHSTISIRLDEHPELRDPARRAAYLRSRTPWIEEGRGPAGDAVLTIHPDRIPAGDTLLVPYQFSATRPVTTDVLTLRSLLVPEVPACVPSNADAVHTADRVGVR